MRSKLHRALSPQKCKFHRTFCHLTILGCGHARPADYSIIESKSKDGFNWWAFLDQIKFREGRRLAEISPVWQHLHWPHSVWILRPEETPNRPAVFSISLCSSQQLLVVRTIGVCRPLGVVSCWRARFDMLTWSGAGYTHPLVARRNQKKSQEPPVDAPVMHSCEHRRHRWPPSKKNVQNGGHYSLADWQLSWWYRRLLVDGAQIFVGGPVGPGGGGKMAVLLGRWRGKKKCRRSVSVAADWSYQLLTRVEQLWRIGKCFFFCFYKKNTRLTVADLFSAYCRVTARARCTRVSYINQRKKASVGWRRRSASTTWRQQQRIQRRPVIVVSLRHSSCRRLQSICSPNSNSMAIYRNRLFTCHDAGPPLAASAAGSEFQLLSCVHMMNNGPDEGGEMPDGASCGAVGSSGWSQVTSKNWKHVNAHKNE